MNATRFYLQPDAFGPRERLLLESGSLKAYTFRFASGVAAIRLTNAEGEIVMLPFQGQQIWSASFQGRELTMRSMFDQPYPTDDYLRTYGGFLLHCGATRMGVPGPDDDHPLHGELPNAIYQQAWLDVGEEDAGPYLQVGGQFRYTVAFAHNYIAEPTVRMGAESSLLDVRLQVHNLKRTPMDLMYLAHANFRPVDDGRLVYSADATPDAVRVRRSIPTHVTPGPGYREYIEELAAHPERHHHLAPGAPFDPEIVFNIDYRSDEEGWAHSLQIHPEGSADYVRHRPAQLGVGVRWISRTPDQDALGLVLPATAEPEGFTAEKEKGNVQQIAAGATWRCDFTLGAVDPEEAGRLSARVEEILNDGAE